MPCVRTGRWLRLTSHSRYPKNPMLRDGWKVRCAKAGTRAAYHGKNLAQVLLCRERSQAAMSATMWSPLIKYLGLWPFIPFRFFNHLHWGRKFKLIGWIQGGSTQPSWAHSKPDLANVEVYGQFWMSLGSKWQSRWKQTPDGLTPDGLSPY